MKSEVFNCCNMELMAKYPDNHFELAIVDPPYGIGMSGTLGKASKKTKGFSFKAKEYKKKDWDNVTPPQEYFDELKRVSKNQIIWGANYFTDKLPIIKNYVFWYKKGQSNDSKFNEGEKRLHPTQKPVRLYEWLLANYAKEGDKILDTHGGSMSSVIACLNLGFEITCTELDKDYYEQAKFRINEHQKQQSLFMEQQEIKFN